MLLDYLTRSVPVESNYYIAFGSDLQIVCGLLTEQVVRDIDRGRARRAVPVTRRARAPRISDTTIYVAGRLAAANPDLPIEVWVKIVSSADSNIPRANVSGGSVN